MANPHPTPRLENLRPPWQPGTSGNPAGYSQGRRISDAIEGLIDELGLQREFGTTAIAMALGKKHLLKQKVTDPETGEDVWVEQKPDLAWFKMIVQRIEPAAQQMDAVTRLSAILDDLEREERAAQEEQGKAAESAGAGRRVAPAQRAKRQQLSQPATLFQDVPAQAGSGQVALKAAQADLPAGDPGTTLAVERPSGQRSVPILHGLLELFNPARHAVRLKAFVDAQLAGLFTGNIRGFPAGNIRIRPRLAGGLGRALAEIAVVACLLLFHQAVVLDDQRAGGHVVQAGAVAADEQHGSQVVRQQRLEPLQGLDIQVMGQLIPDQPARDLVAGEVVAGQAGAHPRTLVTRSTFPELYPVLAPERPPDGKPAPTSKIFWQRRSAWYFFSAVAVGLLNLLRPPSKVRAQAPSVTPEPALVNHAWK